MAGTKISNLPAATTPLNGTEVVPVVQSGITSRTTIEHINTVIATGANAPRTLSDRFADTLNVKDFGAVGDGVTDDTVAIQSALTAIHTALGGTVYVPAGSYKLTETLEVGRNTSLISEGGVRFVRHHSGTMLQNSLGVSSATTGYTGNGNLTVDGGIWDGNAISYYDAFNHFEIGHAENLTFRNLTFLDGLRAHAMDMSAVRNVTIENCKFLGFSQYLTSPDGYGTSSDTLGTRDYSEAVQLDPNTPTSFSFGARDRTICENIVFRNNIVGPNPARNDNTFTSWGVGIGAHGAVNNRFMTGVVITGNEFISCIYAGVKPFKWIEVTISDNVFRGCLRCVQVNPVTYNSASADNPNGTPSGQGQAGYSLSVIGNIFDSYTDAGVAFQAPTAFNTGETPFYTKNVVVNGNSFKDGTSDTAIQAYWIDGLNVTGNVFSNVYRGIDLQFVKNCSVAANTLATSTFEFLSFSEATPSGYSGLGYSSDLVISSNAAKDTGYSGILIAGAVTRLSVTNNLLSNVSTTAATRFGIALSTGANKGFIGGNCVEDGGATNKPLYGISVTSTCSNIALGENKVFGTSGGVNNLGTTPVALTYGSMEPSENNTLNLGGSSKLWATVFATEHKLGSGAIRILTGSNSPESVVTAPVGSIFLRTNGSAGQVLYVKESGTGNTGWAAK